MRRLIIPAVILVAILIIWLIQSKMESEQIKGKVIENFLEIDSEQVNKITIRANLDTLTFFKDASLWYLMDTTAKPADLNSVNNMLTAASTIKAGNVISQNPERQMDFMVDTLTGNLIRFYRDDELLNEIIVGKAASDYAHTYIRKPASNEVYLAEGLLTYVFSRPRIQWLDKTIMAVDPTLIADLELQYPEPGRSFKLIRQGQNWMLSRTPYKDTVAADSVKVTGFLAQFGNLTASDFAKATDSGLIDFDNVSLTLNVNLIDGSTRQVTFAKINEEGTRIYCRRPDLEETLVLNRSRFSSINREFEFFYPSESDMSP